MRQSLLFWNRVLLLFTVPIAFTACAQLSITPQSAPRPNPAVAARAIEAEPVRPSEIMVRDFEFSPSSIKENGSPVHRGIDLFRQTSAEDHRLQIGRAAAASVSQQTLKRLSKLGLEASRIPSGSNAPIPDNTLLVTGRLLEANEGNRLSRVAIGFGAGESSLNTEVHVFRVVDGERAEVLDFTTHADSGKMPGVVPSLGVGELFIGTITVLAKAKGAVSGGEKVYSSQMDYLADRTGDEVARYLSQYAAKEGWIPSKHAQSVNLATK